MITKLIGRTGRVEGREFSISGELTLGAAAENDARILAEGVSRRHAIVRRDGDSFWIEDAGSTNGTFLNGQRVSRDRLHHLDVVTLGRDVDLIFVSREGEAETAAPTGILGASLEILDGPDAGAVVEVLRGELSIGRDPSCTVVLDHPAISKVHARIQRTADAVTIEDLRSTNRTYVNGRQITTATVLGNDDRVELGGMRNLRVQITYGQAPVGTNPALSVPSFDQEWKTRLVWSEQEMEQIRAALASPPPAAKPSDAGKPATPKPAVKAAAKADPVAPKPKPEAKPAAPKPKAEAGEKPSAEVKTDITGEAVTMPMVKPAAAISEVRLVGSSGTFTVRPGSTTVGRGEAAKVRIDNRELSRSHAVFLVTSKSVTVEDLGSTNGTYVNGEKISAPRPLRDGDRVAFGAMEFRVETK